MSISKPAAAVSIVAIVAVTAASMTAVAWAVFPDDNVTHFTGCLNTAGSASGTFSHVAVGDSPAKPCSTTTQTVAHLSGGDITSVSAGAGLTGGGMDGAVSLAVDSAQVQTRVTGDCTTNPGEAIKQIAQDGTVACSAGPSAFVHTAVDGGDVPDDSNTIDSIALPAGKFLVIAKLEVGQENVTLAPTLGVACALNNDDATTADFTAPTDTLAMPHTTLTMITSVTLAAPGSVPVDCSDDGGSPLFADAKWNELTISALKLDDVTVSGG